MAYDLEEQESLEQLKAWWDKWGNLTMTVITCGCLAFAGWNGWNWYKRNQGAKATAAYVQLQTAYAQGDQKNMKSLADGLMNEYPRHVFASLAAMLKASEAQKDGKLEDARAALNWVLDKGGHEEYATIARIRLAGVELDAKDAKKALAVLQGAKVLPGQQASYQDRLGDVYFALGEQAKARDAWNAALRADGNVQAISALVSLKLASLPEVAK